MHQSKRSIASMNAISSTPGARRLLFISIAARLPLTMLGIGLLVHAEPLSGSFAAAGLVAAAYAVSLGVGGPLLGALVDRRGQTARAGRQRRRGGARAGGAGAAAGRHAAAAARRC